MWVVEAFDVVEDGGSGLVVGGEAFPVQEFGLEGGEERLGYGVDTPMVNIPDEFPASSRYAMYM